MRPDHSQLRADLTQLRYENELLRRRIADNQRAMDGIAAVAADLGRRRQPWPARANAWLERDVDSDYPLTLTLIVSVLLGNILGAIPLFGFDSFPGYVAVLVGGVLAGLWVRRRSLGR